MDNASGDDGADLVERTFPMVSVLRLRTNLGFGGAVNRQVGLLPDPMFDGYLILTHEVRLSRGVVGSLCRHMANTADVGVVAPLVGLASQPEVLWSAGGFVRRGSGLPDHLGQNENIRAWEWKVPYEVAWVDGCSMLVRASAHIGVSGFDERFFMYYEDVDYCTRIRRDGWKVVVLPTALAWQEPGLGPKVRESILNPIRLAASQGPRARMYARVMALARLGFNSVLGIRDERRRGLAKEIRTALKDYRLEGRTRSH